MADNNENNNSKDSDKEKSPNVSALKQVKTSYYFRKKSHDDAVDNLESVLDPEKKEEKEKEDIDSDSYYDQLYKTCQFIGDIEKIDFQKGFKKDNEYWGPLKKILRASNIRSRKVKLKGRWWEGDHGPLLGHIKEGNTPVALIKEGSGYVIRNVIKGTTTEINSDNSLDLVDTAHSFFSPLPPGKLTTKDLLKFIFDFTKKDVVLFFALAIVSAILALFIPIMAGYIFNVIIPGNELSSLYQIGILLISLVLCLGAINFVKSIALLRFEGKASYKLQAAVWDRILSLKVPFFRKYDAGNLAERSLGIEEIRTVLSENVMGAIVSAIFSVFYLGLMFYYDVTLSILALGLGLVVATFTLSISLLAYKHVAAQKRLEAIISGFMMMILGGIRKIKMTASEDKVFNIWADKFSEQKMHYARKQRLLIVASVFTFGFPILASILIYIRIFDLLTVPGSAFQIADFIAFNSAYLSFQGALIQAFMVTVPVMSIKPTLKMLQPLLKAETEDYDGKRDIGELKGKIEVKNLKFSYPDSPEQVLRDLSLTINPGELVALVGTSGSGKSTLFRLLLGFEDYEQGTILFDGYDFKELDIRIVRDQMGVVLQDGKIMQGTVLFNIRGSSNYTEEEAWEAAKMAGCAKDIKSLPEQMNTKLQAGGGNLSGGQQQRIVIARALIKQPNILLFDEATSALDNDTQRTVTENVNNLDATKIVIAHRLSTIKDADKIFVLDNGVIKEEGPYEELIEKKGEFYELVKNQMS